MHIEIVRDDAEKMLLNRVKQNNSTWSALYLQHSRLQTLPDEETVVFAARKILNGERATVYFFACGDLVITWHGVQKAMMEALRSELCKQLKLAADAENDRYYDFLAQGEELQFLCEEKIKALKGANTNPPASLDASSEQIRLFQIAAKKRRQREHLEILVVEDQAFSSKLLVGLLERISKPCAALDAHAGLKLYLAHAPDIVFLDIEMPGIGGHELAATLRQLDEDAYVVMVTANNYLADVNRAKQNGAKGFIAKPYSQKKILESIEKYIHGRKSKH